MAARSVRGPRLSGTAWKRFASVALATCHDLRDMCRGRLSWSDGGV